MLQQYKIYRNISLGLIVVLCSTTLLLSLLLYGAFSGDMQAELGHMAASSMTQVAYVVGDLQTRATALSRQLMGDADVVASMFRCPTRPVELYHASRLMSFNRSVQPYVHSILIANGEASRVFGTCDIPLSDEHIIYGQISSAYATGSPVTIPLTLNKAGGGREQVLGLVNYSELSTDGGHYGAVAIGIEPSYVAALMRTVNAVGQGAIMLLDSEGVALTHSDDALLFQNLSEHAHLKRAMDRAKPGYDIANVDGMPCLVSYAPVGRLGWTAISVQPYAVLEQRMRRQLTVTILASLLLLGVGVVVSLWATYRAYRPVARTLASGGYRTAQGIAAISEADFISSRFLRGEELESNARAMGPIVRDALLLQLMTDWQGDVELSVLHQMDIELTGPYFAVCLLCLDEGEGCGGEAGALLVDVAHTLLSGNGLRAHAVVINADTVALLMQLDADVLPTWFPIFFGELQSQMRTHIGASLSCASGSVVTDVDALPESYRSAREKLVYRFFEGNGCLLLGDDYQQGHSAYLPFPQEKEAQLRHAVADGATSAIHCALEPCIEHMRALTPEGAVLFAHQLIIGMIRKLPSLCASGELQSKYMRVLESLRECRLAEQVSDMLERTLISMADCERAAAQPDALDPQVEQMLDCIHRRYTDSGLSLATVSAELNRSGAYLGRLFRTQVGRSFSESLGLYRAERAAELLLTTDETLTSICDQVGIANSNYFYTQFKKIHNCTPQTYRSERKTNGS